MEFIQVLLDLERIETHLRNAFDKIDSVGCSLEEKIFYSFCSAIQPQLTQPIQDNILDMLRIGFHRTSAEVNVYKIGSIFFSARLKTYNIQNVLSILDSWNRSFIVSIQVFVNLFSTAFLNLRLNSL